MSTLRLWPEQGRVGRLVVDPGHVHYLFLYRDTGPDMWTYFLVPADARVGTVPEGPDFYVRGSDVMARLLDEMNVEWLLDADEEVAIEKEFFAMRPLWKDSSS